MMDVDGMSGQKCLHARRDHGSILGQRRGKGFKESRVPSESMGTSTGIGHCTVSIGNVNSTINSTSVGEFLKAVL